MFKKIRDLFAIFAYDLREDVHAQVDISDYIAYRTSGNPNMQMGRYADQKALDQAREALDNLEEL